jgi:membrane associated rhomboid family serine protease
MSHLVTPCISVFFFGFSCLMDIAYGLAGAAAFSGVIAGVSLILLIDAIQDLREIKRLRRSHGRAPLPHHRV